MKRLFTLLFALAALLSLTACHGAAEPVRDTPATAPAETVQAVSLPEETRPSDGTTAVITNVDDFLAAIAPDAEITLGEGDFYLHSAADYGKSKSPYYIWAGGKGEFTLVIQNVPNLTIRGAGPGKTTLLTDPRNVDVLHLKDCENVALEGLSLGHTVRTEPCEGFVLRLWNVANSSLQNLDLYGCGAVGLEGSHCGNLDVQDCTIHDCSLAGVFLSNTNNAAFQNCSFRSIGDNSPAQHVFSVSSCGQVSLDVCDIRDNYVQNVLSSGSEADTVTFRECQFSGNRTTDAMFSFFGKKLVLQDNTFSEDQIRNWYGEGSVHGTDSEGAEVVFEEAPAWAPAKPGTVTPVSTGSQTEVSVKTVDEFLNALQSDTCIILEAPLFDLSTASEYADVNAYVARGEWGDSFDGATDSYYWEYADEGPGLVIEGLHNLTIRADVDDRAAHVISATPRHATVLTFENCSAITLSGFTAGHTREPGYCTGGVVLFRNSEDLLVDNCGLFGCGTIGVQTDACRNLQVVNSEIYECSLAGISLKNTQGAAISGTLIRDIGSQWYPDAPFYQCTDCTDVTLDGQRLDGNYHGR